MAELWLRSTTAIFSILDRKDLQCVKINNYIYKLYLSGQYGGGVSVQKGSKSSKSCYEELKTLRQATSPGASPLSQVWVWGSSAISWCMDLVEPSPNK